LYIKFFSITGGKLTQKEDSMKRRFFLLSTVFFVAFAWMMAGPTAFAAEPIVIGVPTSLGFLEGKESHKAVQLAVGEINASGGVMVGGQKRPFKVVAADLRDAAAGVPVPEALLGLEKLILEQKPTAILVGPFRSEARDGGNVTGYRSKN
jgi:branched-chain amino acid transport system substrate-binding protein